MAERHLLSQMRLGRVRGYWNYGLGLKRYFYKACGRTFNDKTGTVFHYSRPSLRE